LLVVLVLQKPVAEFIDPDWEDDVSSGIGLSYRPARLHGLAGQYDNSMPELTLSPSHGSMNSTIIIFILFQVSVCGEGSTSEEEKINEIQDEMKEIKVQDKDQEKETEMERVKEANKMEEIKEKKVEEKRR
jgi:hypothetical protein